MTTIRSFNTSLRAVSTWLLVFGVVSTAIASLAAQWRVDSELAARFELRVREAKFNLERQVNTYVEILRGLQAQFIANPAISRSDFVQVTELLKLDERLPGVQAVGFARLIPVEEKAAFFEAQSTELQLAQAPYPVPRMHSLSTTRDLFIVQYIEPIARNRGGAWFDQYSDRSRRDAIERARDSGGWTATGRVRLFVDPGNIYGVVIFMPVYLGGAVPSTVEERRALFLGAVFLGIRIHEMLESVVVAPGLDDDLRFNIRDAGDRATPETDASDARALFTMQSDEPAIHAMISDAARSLETTFHVNLGGGQWEVDVVALPEFRAHAYDWLPVMVGLVGLLLSVMFFYIVRTHERSLHSRERNLKGILQSIEQVLWTFEYPAMKVKYVSPGVERMYGTPAAEFYADQQLWLQSIHPEDRARILSTCRDVVMSGKGALQYRIIRTDGCIRWIRHDVHAIADVLPGTWRVDAIASDITIQYLLEESLRRSNRALRAIHDCEKVLAAATDEDHLLQQVCDVIASAGYQMVWAGCLSEDGSRIVAAGLTGHSSDFLKCLEIPLQASSSLQDSAIGEALCSRQPTVANDFSKEGHTAVWHTEALRRGFHSKIALPLLDSEEAIGVLTVYSSEVNAFDAEEVELLAGLAKRVMTTMQVHRNRSLRQATEAALHLRQRAIEASPNAIIITSATGPDYPVEYVNPAFEKMTGYAAEEIVGQSLRILQGDDRDQPGLEQIRQIIHTQQEGHAVLRNYCKDGTQFWSDVHIAPVRDDSGEVRHFVATKFDITQIKQSEAQLEHLANHDVLTGLPNRGLLRDRLGQSIAYAQRTGRAIWVVFLDLDRFKIVNDSFGHRAGDMLLRTVGERLQSAVRKTDTVARIGGDEFVVVLPERVDGADFLGVGAIQRIRETIAQPTSIEGVEFIPTCSIGVAVYPTDGTDAELLMTRADIAMYRAKQSGRSNFQFYASEMELQSLERLRLEHEMRSAIERMEFELHYQPQVNSMTGQVVGTEALIRWRHPKRGLISPGVFISLAEETGLIVPIGSWVLRTACAQNKAWHRAGLAHLRISINLSARQFAQPDLATTIMDILQETGMDPQHLEIELTESMVMKDVDRAIEILGELNAIGVRIAIDDFGTGYSSLSYLKQFPIHTLKIDRSFVSDITSDVDGAAIVSSIISLSHSLKLKVIAEGVETQQQLDHLRDCGCDEFQGYHFSKPIPANGIEELLLLVA